MRKINIILLILIIIPLIFALDEQQTYKKGVPLDYKVACDDASGSICNSTVACSITINYPNGSNMAKNELMTRDMTYYNYTLSDSNTTGVYSAIINCSSASTEGLKTAQFRITNYGANQTPYGLAIILMALPFLVGLFCIIWAVNIDGSNKWIIGIKEDPVLEVNYAGYLKLFLFLGSYVCFWVMLFFVWQTADTFEVIPSLVDILRTVFNIWTFIFYPLILVVTLLGVIKFVTDTKYLKMAERGLKPR
jgi:hypothetical protein